MTIKELVKEIFTNIKSNWFMPVTENQVYSTEEQKVGAWIDGKPLYRKTNIVDNPSDGAKIPFAENVDLVCCIYGVWTNANGRSHKITFADSNTLTVWAEPSGFSLEFSSALASSVKRAYVTIEYTKTTDTTETTKVPFEPLVEYSENEKMIGYWIDGCPIVRRVIQIPTLAKKSVTDTGIVLNNYKLLLKENLTVSNYDNSDISTGIVARLQIRRSDSHVLYYLDTSSSAVMSGTAIIEYVKTTD